MSVAHWILILVPLLLLAALLIGLVATRAAFRRVAVQLPAALRKVPVNWQTTLLYFSTSAFGGWQLLKLHPSYTSSSAAELICVLLLAGWVYRLRLSFTKLKAMIKHTRTLPGARGFDQQRMIMVILIVPISVIVALLTEVIALAAALR